MTDHGKWQDDVEAWQAFYGDDQRSGGHDMTYDPVPDLAALIDGLHATASAAELGSPNSGLIERLAYLLAGPYAGLRGGLLLDEPGREHLTTEQALREALDLSKPDDQEDTT